MALKDWKKLNKETEADYEAWYNKVKDITVFIRNDAHYRPKKPWTSGLLLDIYYPLGLHNTKSEALKFIKSYMKKN